MDTLCWRCRNATNSGCSWSKRFIPVKGWIAKESRQRDCHGKYSIQTFTVFACPRYVPDAVWRGENGVRYVTYNGMMKPLVQWAREYSLKPDTLRSRLDYGWSVEAALTTKVRGAVQFNAQ